ncbi:MAG: flagellar hook-associated protein FlgL [Candidatus Cloacimonetes bacterium]|nr:flagellar hook-associated protein FlgL [Candidatus Cloacimonadota bacterium]
MRVTQQQLINNFLKNVNGHNSKLLDINNKVSSGKAVEKPQDGSIAAAAITRIQARLSETEQFRENILQSLSKLNTADSTMGDISALITRTRELAVQGANGTLSIDERDAIAVEVNQLLESLVQIGNTTVGGSVLFGGHESLGKPFDVIRGTDLGEVRDLVTIDGVLRKDINANNITRVVYNGDGQRSGIEVDQALAVDYNVTGKDLFFYDDKINNSGPSLGRKEIGITEKTLLKDIRNAKGAVGIASGLITIRNTSAMHLRENTDPGYPANPALDNSTRLAVLNNGQGVAVAGADITLTDSMGNNLNINGMPAFTRVQEVVDYLNTQTNTASFAMRFRIENDQIKIYDSAGGTGIPRAADNGASTFARDLNLTGFNPDFSVPSFNRTTRLADWLGTVDLSSVTLGNLRLRDSTGVETTVSTAGLNATSTVGDLMNLINQSGSRVNVDLSVHGYGLAFRDNGGGSGNFFIEDVNPGSIANVFNFNTPVLGVKDNFDTGSQRTIDLSGIGDTVLTVGEMLNEINSQIEGIGVVASLDPVTSQFVFEDIRIPEDRGKFRINVANAISSKTSLDTLNDGGGINNFKIGITDSTGVSQIVDFEDATKVEDVINALNLRYEPITERTHLRNLEGVEFPLGTVSFTSSAGTVQVDLSAIPGVVVTQPIGAAAAANEANVRDLHSYLRDQLSPIQLDVSVVLDSETRGLSFQFTDLGVGDGLVGISDTAGSSASQFKFATLGVGDTFTSGTVLHKRVGVIASLNDDRTGIRLVDSNGGALTVFEVEGRTTAFDLGLVPSGATQASSNASGVLRGRNLNVFNKVAEDMGVSTSLSQKVFTSENTLNAGQSIGSIDNTYQQTRSVSLNTRDLSTLQGSVNLNPILHQRVPLSLLNNASANPDYKGNPMKGIDLTGVLRIRLAVNQDGAVTAGDTGVSDELILNLNQLPDNATWDDMQRLIDEQIASDTSFPAQIRLSPTADGKMNFLSDIPFVIEEVAGFEGAFTMENIFGTNLPDTYAYKHQSNFIQVQKPMTGGIDRSNFYFDEVGGLASFEVDLDYLGRQSFKTRDELEIGDVIRYIERFSGSPKELTNDVRLKDLGVSLPFNETPFNGANELNDASTLGDFLTRFNAAGFGFQLEIASATNAPASMIGKALVSVPGAAGNFLAGNFATQTMSKFLDNFGVSLGGTTSLNGTPGVNGQVGRSISGLGTALKVSLNNQGSLRIDSSDTRIRMREGNGTTARDLRIIEGTGAVGDGTRIIHTGNLNPSVTGKTLMSELVPNFEGLRTNFMNQLKDLYVENGKDGAFIRMTEEVPVTMETAFKALNSGYYDETSGIYRGGVDVGRKNSGFVIVDQFGNRAFVDLSNNQSETAVNAQADLEKQFVNKPFYDNNMTLEDLQVALDIAVAKAKLDPANTGFGVDEIKIQLNESGGYSLGVIGKNGPTITISNVTDADGRALSTTAKDLGLLREVGARGNGSPNIIAGPIRVEPTINYLVETVNRDLSSASVTMSIGTSAQGPTLDITSNTDSEYIKVRDTRDGNSASQLGLSATRSIFQTLIDLRDALARDDANFISEEILAKIGDDEEKVLQYRARVGSVVNRFEANVDRLEITKIELTKRLSENQDINLTDAIIQLRQAENAQTASLNVGARIIQQTLLDFLR